MQNFSTFRAFGFQEDKEEKTKIHKENFGVYLLLGSVSCL